MTSNPSNHNYSKSNHTGNGGIAVIDFRSTVRPPADWINGRIDPSWLEPFDEHAFDDPKPIGDFGPSQRLDPVEIKLRMLAGMIVRKAAFRAACKLLSPFHFDQTGERYAAVTWTVASAQDWPVDPAKLRAEINDRIARDPAWSNAPASRELLADLLNRIDQGNAPDDAEAMELVKNFARECQDNGKGSGNGASGAGRKSQADLLVELSESLSVELFHRGDQAYATVPVMNAGNDLYHETCAVSSGGFRDWISRQFYNTYRKAPGSQAMQDAINTLKGKARFEGVEQAVYVRLARQDAAIYLDLADDQGRAVKVTPGKWEIVKDPPVKFVRPSKMLPLPVPVRGGSIDELRELVNLPDDESWTLTVALLIAALKPEGPHAAGVANGEQGSGKSTLLKMFRRLIDPNVADLRSPPKDETNLMIAAANGWIIAIDNASHIGNDLSDALCRLATGAGLSSRRLYTDADENVITACRPIIINGIGDLATRPDLLDRVLQISLPNIDGPRKTEAQLWDEFDRRRPRIIGAMLDAVATALANLPTTNPANLPRMADFAKWIIAAEPALPWRPGTFMAHYDANRLAAQSVALDANPIAATVQRFANGLRLMPGQSWTGTATELLLELEKLLPFDVQTGRRTRPDNWPKLANALSNQLMRMAPALRAQGVTVARGKGRNRRMVTVTIS